MLKKILIGAGVTIGAGLIIAATGWNFLATADMPGRFVSKSDFLIFAECNEKDHDRINDKLDKIYDLLMQHYTERIVRSSTAHTPPADFDEINSEYNFNE